jgi:hypothetical protein
MEIVCIGCGCTDERSCEGGCHWLAVNEDRCIGVCSNCPEFLEAGEDEGIEPDAGLILPDDRDFDDMLRAMRD